MSHPTPSSKSPGRTQGAKLEGYVVRHGEFRNRILDAAEALIAETGDTSFGTRELAIRAGVSAATPFNHFRSKRGILSAIVERSLEQLGAQREPPTRVGDPLERIFRDADNGPVATSKHVGISSLAYDSRLIATASLQLDRVDGSIDRVN